MESVLPEPEGIGLKPSRAGLPPIQPLVVAGKCQLLGLQNQLSDFKCCLHDFPLSASVSGPCSEDTSRWVRVTLVFRVLNLIMCKASVSQQGHINRYVEVGLFGEHTVNPSLLLKYQAGTQKLGGGR